MQRGSLVFLNLDDAVIIDVGFLDDITRVSSVITCKYSTVLSSQPEKLNDNKKKTNGSRLLDEGDGSH